MQIWWGSRAARSQTNVEPGRLLSSLKGLHEILGLHKEVEGYLGNIGKEHGNN